MLRSTLFSIIALQDIENSFCNGILSVDIYIRQMIRNILTVSKQSLKYIYDSQNTREQQKDKKGENKALQNSQEILLER